MRPGVCPLAAERRERDAGSLAVAVEQLAPLRVSLLIGIGGLIFALGHPIPPGPIGMTLFLVGVALLELKYRPARASAHTGAVPALQP